MDEAPIKPIEKKNDATKRTRVRFTIMASFIFGEGLHLRETHGNIKAVPPRTRRNESHSRHLLELGTSYQRTADQMAPPRAIDSFANVPARSVQGLRER